MELGCGAGLASIVAAECGANVVATDISPTVIKLCKTGWKETQTLRQKEEQARKSKLEKRQKLQRLRQLNNVATATNGDESSAIEEKEKEGDESVVAKPGTLNTLNFDMFSKEPLPAISSDSSSSSSSNQKKMVIATAMMYDAGLATVLAKRAMEACACGAWVIIGDGDEGNRENGRIAFLSEMDRLEKEQGVAFRKIWTISKVKSKVLRWNDKHVKVLHLNAPEDEHAFLEDPTSVAEH